MTNADALSDLVDETWDDGSPLCSKLERRFTDQFAEQLLGEDAIPRLRTLYRTLGGHKPLAVMSQDLTALPDPLFWPSYPEFQARSLPPDLQAAAVGFFRTVMELATRYAGEFIARNADLTDLAPEHNRDYYFLNRTVDQILVQLERHLEASRDADEAVVEFALG